MIHLKHQNLIQVITVHCISSNQYRLNEKQWLNKHNMHFFFQISFPQPCAIRKLPYPDWSGVFTPRILICPTVSCIALAYHSHTWWLMVTPPSVDYFSTLFEIIYSNESPERNTAFPPHKSTYSTRTPLPSWPPPSSSPQEQGQTWQSHRRRHSPPQSHSKRP